MQKNDRFGKEWSSGSAAQEYPTDQQAQQGLSFLGATPPSWNLHDAMFQALDWKDNFLFEQIKAVLDEQEIEFDLTEAGTRTQLAEAISTAIAEGIANQQVATEAEAGIAAIATQAEVDAGEDDAKFVTSLKLHSAVGDIAQNIAVFDTDGVTEWIVPDVLKGGVRKALVEVIGGGGGAGRTNMGGAGGGGGGYTERLVDLTNISSVNITIGAGGPGRAGTEGAGESGGSSSFGPYCSAPGGNGATGNGAVPGSGGVGVGGNFNTSLGPGSSVGSTTGSIYTGGSGGGPGARGTTEDGISASEPGGGGGGGGSNRDGGAGASGIIIVRW